MCKILFKKLMKMWSCPWSYDKHLKYWLSMLRPRNRWISAARIIEYPQANLFDRSICFLVWATLASFWKPSRSVYMRQTINFDEINVSNRHVYYPVNTCIRIALISSLIDGFSRTNCQLWVHLKGVEETPLFRLAGASLLKHLTINYPLYQPIPLEDQEIQRI